MMANSTLDMTSHKMSALGYRNDLCKMKDNMSELLLLHFLTKINISWFIIIKYKSEVSDKSLAELFIIPSEHSMNLFRFLS